MTSGIGKSLSLAALVLIVILTAGAVSEPAAAAQASNHGQIGRLLDFVRSVSDGDGSILRGVYVPRQFEFAVAQQPYDAFISEEPNALTEFARARTYGVVGLLAHNWLAGRDFFRLDLGQRIYLIYGDGRIASFWVWQVQQYRATIPNSPYSDFVDLSDGRGLNAEELFRRVYMGNGHITLQTCIEANGDPNWGRLFIIAEPMRPLGVSSWTHTLNLEDPPPTLGG